MSHRAARPAGWPARRLARLGCLLPIGALVLFLLVFFAWPYERHKPASDFHAVAFFLSLGLVPLTALAGVVLSIMAAGRARREQQGAGRFLRPALVVIIALACVAVTAFIIWMALQGLAGFR
jgi:hypothetical protein